MFEPSTGLTQSIDAGADPRYSVSQEEDSLVQVFDLHLMEVSAYRSRLVVATRMETHVCVLQVMRTLETPPAGCGVSLARPGSLGFGDQ